MAIASPPRPSGTTEAVRKAITGHRGSAAGYVFQVLLLVALLGSLVILIVLMVDVISGSLATFADRGWSFVTSPLSPDPERAGVWQAIYGSFIVGLFVVILTFPIGIGAAIYLEEYAKESWFTRIVSVNIRNLAGVPSVVYGLLGLSIFVGALKGFTGGRSIISAGLTIAILVLPIVIITAAEALRAVPQSIREAGFGVGATRWEVTRSHVLPYAAPGILTGTVLSLARALGEAAPLILIGAATFYSTAANVSLYEKLQGPFTALPYVVFNWARQPSQEFRELTSAAIVVMLVVLLTANAAAILLRNRYEKKRTA
ncbi:MAG: phosphate ABC transporter permease PstA [Acidimicrobiales bacterium]|nr:phosphate ABC transporter permease PstA [Acidimicrobiales bacterium]